MTTAAPTAHPLIRGRFRSRPIEEVVEEAKTLAEELKSQGYSCAAVQADVRDASQVAEAVEEGMHQMGEIDILVNNAGVCRLGNSWNE